MKTPKLFILLSAMVGLILTVSLMMFIIWQQSTFYQPLLLGKLLFYGFFAFTIIFLGNLIFIVGGISLVKLPYSWLRPLHTSLNIFYPVLRAAGKLAGIDKDRIQGLYIEVHNSITKNALQKAFTPGETLILLPHCLQPETCMRKITTDIHQCAECGACMIAKVKKLSQLGYKVKVVPGGTMARQEIEKQRPRFIVAVACENDLSQGIMGVDKLPVFGVVNQRPHGPCCRTTFRFEELENLLKEYNLRPIDARACAK
ncbi:MAG TPA: DUF116 domain-containing protein [Bacillota bacterium]|nr:DUF116 domain-containing protein [Bacillota bacterium]